MAGLLQRLRRDDSGTTLAEMLVSMVLLGIIGTITSTALISGQRATTATTTRVESSSDDRVALQVITKALRTATRTSVTPTSPYFSPSAFTTAGDAKVSFYANDQLAAGAGPTLTTYELMADGSLVETRVAATKVTPVAPALPYFQWTATPRTRVLLRGLAATPVFRFYDVRDTCPAGCQLATTGTPAVLAATTDVDAVGVTLSLTRVSSGKPMPVTVTNRIGVRRNNSPLAAS